MSAEYVHGLANPEGQMEIRDGEESHGEEVPSAIGQGHGAQHESGLFESLGWLGAA